MTKGSAVAGCCFFAGPRLPDALVGSTFEGFDASTPLFAGDAFFFAWFRFIALETPQVVAGPGTLKPCSCWSGLGASRLHIRKRGRGGTPDDEQAEKETLHRIAHLSIAFSAMTSQEIQTYPRSRYPMP